MKSDQEVIDFIDSKEALTRSEISMFLYGTKQETGQSRIQKFWAYVLKTKDPVKLREYVTQKIVNGNRRKDADKIRKIIKTDIRFHGCGAYMASKLMQSVYKIRISISCISPYLKEYHNVQKETYKRRAKRIF